MSDTKDGKPRKKGFFNLKRGPGQPSKLTQETKDLLFQALLGGCYIKDACAYADIGVSTYMSWVEKAKEDNAAGKRSQYVEFLEEATRVFEKSKPRLEVILANGAEADPRIALSILERRYPAEWGRTNFIKGNMEHAGELKIVFVEVDGDGVRSRKARDVLKVPDGQS